MLQRSDGGRGRGGGVLTSLLWEGGGLQRGGRAKEEGGRRNQLGQAGGLGVGEREEEGSRSKQTLRVTYKGAEGTRRHTQDSGQATRPHWREATVRAWGAGCGDRKQDTAHRTLGSFLGDAAS